MVKYDWTYANLCLTCLSGRSRGTEKQMERGDSLLFATATTAHIHVLEVTQVGYLLLKVKKVYGLANKQFKDDVVVLSYSNLCILFPHLPSLFPLPYVLR